MAADQAEKVVDVFTHLDTIAATSSQELATAFARTANSSHDAGLEFEQLAGLITTVSETTRKSAITVGQLGPYCQ